MTALIVAAGLRGGAWLSTYFVHSCVLLGGVLLFARCGRPSTRMTDRLCKAAAVLALASATVATTVDLRPFSGRLELPPAVRAIHIIKELRTIEPGEGASSTRVLRENRVIEPAFPQPAHLAAVAFGFWLLFACWRVARLFRRRHALFRRIAQRAPLRDPTIEAWLRTLPGTAGIRVTVDDAIPCPAAVARNEICIPRRVLEELSEAEQQTVLAHEIAHIVRRDPAWLTALSWCHAVFFFQPLNGRILARFRRTAEVLCDDWAVAATGRPITLARSITRVATWIRETSAMPVPAMAEPGVTFVDRIERLVHTPPAEAGGRAATLLCTPALLAITLFGAPAVGAGGHDRVVERTLGGFVEDFELHRDIEFRKVDEGRRFQARVVGGDRVDEDVAVQ